MDNKKRAEFVRRMGKKRLSLVKGGMVHRKKMGLGGLLGLDGGSGGTGFAATPGVKPEQITAAYNNAQGSLGKQQQLTDTLAPQAKDAVNSQGVLSKQFENQAAGNGPNVAVNRLNQATGANVANQAALMAGQRGAGTNPALIARQAAMTGATAEQQAAGEAATLQAQQQIASEQAAAQLAANEISQSQAATNAENQATQNEQGILENANTAYSNIQGNLANTTMQGQQGLIGGIMNGVGGALGLDEGGEVSAENLNHHDKKLEFVHKMTELGLKHHGKLPKMSDGGPTPSPTPSDKSIFGLPEASAADKPPRTTMDPDKAKQVSDSFKSVFADGGLAVPQVNYQAPQAPIQTVQSEQGGFQAGPNSGAAAMGNSMKSSKKDKKDKEIPGQNMLETKPVQIGAAGSSDLMTQPSIDFSVLAAAKGGVMPGPHKSHVANYLMAEGGKVPALVSPGEVYLKPDQVDQVVSGGADPLSIGQRFPGKAKVKGDSKKNDFIPADLDEGGVVIDRENAFDSKKAMRFVHKSIAKKKARSK